MIDLQARHEEALQRRDMDEVGNVMMAYASEARDPLGFNLCIIEAVSAYLEAGEIGKASTALYLIRPREAAKPNEVNI